MRGRPLWPPAVPRLAARPSQSNPRGSGPEVLKRERGHVTSETRVAEVAVFGALQRNADKVTSRMNRPIRSSTQIRNYICLIDNTIMWRPSLFFMSNRFYRTQNDFGPLNDHIITKFSWVVTMVPIAPSTDILRWPVTSQWSSSRRV